jgi:hypothetical protein
MEEFFHFFFADDTIIAIESDNFDAVSKRIQQAFSVLQQWIHHNRINYAKTNIMFVSPQSKPHIDMNLWFLHVIFIKFCSSGKLAKVHVTVRVSYRLENC